MVVVEGEGRAGMGFLECVPFAAGLGKNKRFFVFFLKGGRMSRKDEREFFFSTTVLLLESW